MPTTYQENDAVTIRIKPTLKVSRELVGVIVKVLPPVGNTRIYSIILTGDPVPALIRECQIVGRVK